MTKSIFAAISVFIFIGLTGFVLANGEHTAQEEAEGKAIWEKLTSKEITCDKLTDENFGALGEYFMGQMMGDSHEAMNNMMIQTMGEKGEGEMHIAMGKRMSGCGALTELPQGGWMPMMQGMGKGMMGGGGMMGNFGWNPMSFGGFGFFGWTFMIFWWVLIALGIVAVVTLIKRLLK